MGAADDNWGRALTALTAPIAQSGLDQGEGSHPRSVGAQDARPERDPEYKWLPQQQFPLLAGKAAFGTDQQVDAGVIAAAAQRLQRIGDVSRLVAEHEQAVRRALRQETLERHRLTHLCQAEDAALLGRLDDVGAHALAVDAGHLGVPCDHRRKRRDSHFDRLLDHVVEPRVLQRREDISEVGEPVLWPGPMLDRQAVGPLAAADQTLPFAVAAVEDQDAAAGAKAEHIAEIVALVAVQFDMGAVLQGRIDIQARRVEVVFGHVASTVKKRRPYQRRSRRMTRARPHWRWRLLAALSTDFTGWIGSDVVAVRCSDAMSRRRP